MATIKVQKEIQDVFLESAACRMLADQYGGGWFPSMKAIYYMQKAEKARTLAWRALRLSHPHVTAGEWTYNSATGLASKDDAPVGKPVRKPRKPKEVSPATAAAHAVRQGEVK